MNTVFATRCKLLNQRLVSTYNFHACKQQQTLSRRFGTRMSYVGPVQKHIEQTVQEALKPSHLEVTNESHGRKEDESHFHVLVVSEEFEQQKSLIEKHRRVQSLFTDGDGNLKFHSLRITAKTPKQWEKKNSVPAAPKCTGKGDGRHPTDVTKL
mmetsp:Transcript_12110/g.13928  ORF Transcript_12110/g.13928 Transcript_12110/m.13928 type:complete len:154 (-) Transcript_12110:598-1059(-)